MLFTKILLVITHDVFAETDEEIPNRHLEYLDGELL
jgi:hypothetical protein